MKRIWKLMLAAALVLNFAGCGIKHPEMYDFFTEENLVEYGAYHGNPIRDHFFNSYLDEGKEINVIDAYFGDHLGIDGDNFIYIEYKIGASSKTNFFVYTIGFSGLNEYQSDSYKHVKEFYMGSISAEDKDAYDVAVYHERDYDKIAARKGQIEYYRYNPDKLTKIINGYGK